MKTKTKLTITTLILSLTLALSACSAVNNAVEEALQGGIQTGTWSEDGTTFSNEWSNINFTLPDGFRALSSEEIQAAVGAGDDVVVNNSNLKQSDIDAAKLRSAYDFMITTESGVPNAMLMYENTGVQPLLKNLDEAGYFESMKTQLEAVEQMNYAAVGTNTMEIAGDSWYVGTMSIADGAAYQDYCIKKVEAVFVVLCVTYTDETKEDATDFVSGIKNAE